MSERETLRAFLSRPAHVIAPELLGWTIASHSAAGMVAVELTEVEAYEGESDPASHAWRGRTERNAAMYGPAGHLYVYRSYGVHLCANIVTGPEGQSSAVLMRAGRVVAGAELARTRRGERVPDRSLARGPGCLGQALALAPEHYGIDLLDSAALTLNPATDAPLSISCGPRVGVSRAGEVAWRHWVTGDESVSAFRPGRAAARRRTIQDTL